MKSTKQLLTLKQKIQFILCMVVLVSVGTFFLLDIATSGFSNSSDAKKVLTRAGYKDIQLVTDYPAGSKESYGLYGCRPRGMSRPHAYLFSATSPKPEEKDYKKFYVCGSSFVVETYYVYPIK